jgi:DNA-binding transcriptional MocR family regulator
MNVAELQEMQAALQKQYEDYKKMGLSLNMSRGKPSKAQLDLSMAMLDIKEVTAADGTDARNYGVLDGLPEAKAFMADFMSMPVDNVIVFGNSSLNIMYDTVMRAYVFGVLPGSTPWKDQGKLKFLCPVPGYDRHFGVTEEFGFELIAVPMTENGPDMDIVEKLVANDAQIKGIWCVPKYSNPEGYVYSDETVRRMASMKTAADDFRVFWDNAYCVHYLDMENQAEIPNFLEECAKAGNPERPYIFGSTSKITFPGAGVAAFAAGPETVKYVKKLISAQTIGHDKLNQLRHVKFFGDKAGLMKHMAKHAAILKPKFDIVAETLDRELGGLGCADWTTPKGGYFMSFNTLPGLAKKVVAMCKEAGVELTGAGATYPYGKDPEDKNIRLAPSMPPVEDLKVAAELFCLCVKLASVEKILAEK